MKSIGDRLGRWEKLKQGDFWDWIKSNMEPWLMWLSGLSATLQIKWWPVWFPGRARVWDADHIPKAGM